MTIASACSFSVSTANISGLKIVKDETMQQETSTYQIDIAEQSGKSKIAR